MVYVSFVCIFWGFYFVVIGVDVDGRGRGGVQGRPHRRHGQHRLQVHQQDYHQGTSKTNVDSTYTMSFTFVICVPNS